MSHFNFFNLISCALIIFICCITQSNALSAQIIAYTIQENLPPQTLDPNVGVSNNLNGIQILSQFTPHPNCKSLGDSVRIYANFSLQTLTQLDREACFEYEADVFDSFESQVYTIVVKVEDINDHDPFFSTPACTVNVSETLKDTINLNTDCVPPLNAFDFDGSNSGLFGIDSYEILSDSGRGVFELESPEELSLLAREQLDVDVEGAVDTMTIVISVRDYGQPPKTGRS